MIRRTIKNKKPLPPPIKGGQGRSASDIRSDATVLGCLASLAIILTIWAAVVWLVT